MSDTWNRFCDHLTEKLMRDYEDAVFKYGVAMRSGDIEGAKKHNEEAKKQAALFEELAKTNLELLASGVLP